jgi:hypothetical protein
VGFVVGNVALGTGFSPEYFGFPLLIAFHRWSFTMEKQKNVIILLIGLLNMP